MTLKPGAKSSPKLNIDWLKSQTKNVQKEILETLTALSESEAQALIWNWPFWARQDQLPPPGNWLAPAFAGRDGACAGQSDRHDKLASGRRRKQKEICQRRARGARQCCDGACQSAGSYLVANTARSDAERRHVDRRAPSNCGVYASPAGAGGRQVRRKPACGGKP